MKCPVCGSKKISRAGEAALCHRCWHTDHPAQFASMERVEELLMVIDDPIKEQPND